MGNRIGDVGKPHCFNGFQVALNMLKAAFWSPAEPTWDFKVCAAPRPNGHFAGGGWLPTGVPSVITWNRPTTRPARFRPAGGRRTLLFFLLRKVFCLGFQRVAGAKPPPGAGGFTATDSPDSPTNSSEEPFLLCGIFVTFPGGDARHRPVKRVCAGVPGVAEIQIIGYTVTVRKM